MKYLDNWKIEFASEKAFDDEYRYVYYRIDPSELNLFQRWFSNPWLKTYYHYAWGAGGLGDLWTPKRFMMELKPMTTYGEIRKYLEKQQAVNDKNEADRRARGEIW